MAELGISALIVTINFIRNKRQEIELLWDESKDFLNLMDHLVLILKDIEETMGDEYERVNKPSGNTTVRRSIKRLKKAIHEAKDIIDQFQSSKSSRLKAAIFSSSTLTGLRAAAGRVRDAIVSLQSCGLVLQANTLDLIEIVKEDVQNLDASIKELGSKSDDLRSMIERSSAKMDKKLQTILEALKDQGLVSDAQDFHEQAQEIAKETMKLMQEEGKESLGKKSGKQHLTNIFSQQMVNMVVQVSQVPNQLYCPITRDIMRDPVILMESGITYDHEALCQALLINPDREPSTGQSGYDKMLTFAPNISVRQVLMETLGDSAYEPYHYPEFHSMYNQKWYEEVKGSEITWIENNDPPISPDFVQDVSGAEGTCDEEAPSEPVSEEKHMDDENSDESREVGNNAIIVCLFWVIVAVVVGVSVAKRKEDEVSSPVRFSWNQVGQDLEGEVTFTEDGNFADEDFGWRVALSSDGKTLAASSMEHDGLGHVRVFRLIDSAWQLFGELRGEESLDHFGMSVDLSSDGTILAVGARQTCCESDRGYAKAFQFDGSQWRQLGEALFLDQDESYDIYHFGSAVSLSADGNTMAVGANYGTGFVKVFRINDDRWNQTGQTLRGEAYFDHFGTSVALSLDGDILAVGATHNDGNGVSSGHVRVFQFDGNQWQRRGQDLDGRNDEQFGSTVALSENGNILAAGSNSTWGIAKVFHFDGAKWIQHGDFISARGSSSVALAANGSIIAVGSPYPSKKNGLVEVFSWQQSEEGAWERNKIGETVHGDDRGDHMGWAVALSSDGKMLAAGAPRWNDASGRQNAGLVRVFSYDLVD